MTSSRAESQHSHFGRRRSNTAQSVLRPLPPPTPNPLKVGDSRTFNLWVHETKDAAGVLFNHSSWPGAMEGDLMRVNKHGSDNLDESFLFFVPKEDQCPRTQLQVKVTCGSGNSQAEDTPFRYQCPSLSRTRSISEIMERCL